ncbi:MAG: hypothetical protein A2544_00995 [Candidatus Zambryskibacteria bacterium RIFOXYD2_FULL_43_10]|uniref:Nucleotidase n=1 Tax=Candidatus Zambryskibacteria bacterium RIFOXYD2_FULL_43_10 TaxID=1802782 RepID=A0A1G2V4M4_9BACT|nr:MAG: hypothetical protein A2544_00995 [Candidatus Zambryskibacteria bacterium RIFOXYD2_FULL_43_10]
MIIGFDLDNVLLNFSEALHAHHNATYGTKYKTKDVKFIELHKVWNCTEEEAKRRVFDFFGSQNHWSALPINGAVEGIQKLKHSHRLFVVTSKPEELREKTLEWLDRHFPKKFDEIHFTNQYYGNGPERTKGEVCKELGIEIFVDDFLHNVEDVANLGIPALLFNAPWNQGEVKPPITRVYSWDEIVDFCRNE